MLVKLGLVALGFVLVCQDGGVDVAHYDPDARRKVFRTEIEWAMERLEVTIDGNSFDLLSLLGRRLAGDAQWELSVRDSLRFEDGELVFVARDYEDVILRGSLADGSRLLGLGAPSAIQIWGGMERERVSFRRMCAAEDSSGEAPGGEWDLELPWESPLKAAGLGGLQPRVDLAAFAPGEGCQAGDTWEVPASHLEQLLFPVGHPATLLAPLGWARVAEVDVPEGGVLDSAEGAIQVSFVESSEDGSLSRLRLEIDSKLEISPQAALAAAGQVYVDGRDFETGPPFSAAEGVEGRFGVAIEGTGELVWNHALHAFESLELPLDFQSTIELHFDVGVRERAMSVRVEADCVGEVQLSYSR